LFQKQYNFWGLFTVHTSVKIDANKFFEVFLLDIPFSSAKDLFKKIRRANCVMQQKQ
jgi:hypothetical protein